MKRFKNLGFGKMLCTAATFIFLFSNSTFAADRYWVAPMGIGTWDDAANWSTSSAGVGGASVPTGADVAFFNSNGLGDCIIDAIVDVRGLDIGNGYSGTITQGSYDIFVGAAFFYMNSGTFLGGDRSISVDRFYLSGGTFTSTSGLFSCSGVIWEHMGGNFIHNNGTVTFDAPVSTVITLSSTTSFYNLTFNIGSGSADIQGSANKISTKGTLSLAGAKIGGVLPIEVFGDVYVSADYNGGSSTLKFTGSATQYLAMTSSYPGKYKGDITIDKSSGKVQLTNPLAVATGRALNVANGTFDLNGNDLTLNGALLVSGTGILQLKGNETVSGLPRLDSASTVIFNGTSSSYTLKNWSYANLTVNGGDATTYNLPADLNISGILDLTNGKVDAANHVISHKGITGSAGSMTVDIASVNAPNSANLGNLGLVITSPVSLGATNIELFFSPIEANGYMGINRTYKVTPSYNVDLDATIVFNYYDSELNGSTESDLLLNGSNDETIWLEMSSSVNTTTNELSANHIDKLGWFTAASSDAPIASLLNLATDVTGEQVLLTWITTTELDNEMFTIEKSENPEHGFASTGMLHGAGNSNGVVEYYFSDDNPFDGMSYYRLKLTNFSGISIYSTVIDATVDRSAVDKVTVFPNPINPVSKTLFASGLRGTSGIEQAVCIMDVTGVIVQMGDVTTYNDSGMLSFDVSDLPMGIYFLKVYGDVNPISKRFVISK